jgi:hypothetical protein
MADGAVSGEGGGARPAVPFEPMARPRYPRRDGPLPPPLPPETRTVGQLVGETVRLYGERFWRSVALGVGPAAATIVGAETSRRFALVFATTAGAVLVAASFVGACALVAGRAPDRRSLAAGFLCALVVFAPLPALTFLYVVPALLWLVFLGLSVPAAVIERRRPGDALARGVQLLRADAVHAVFSLVTLVVLYVLSQSVLFFLLRGAGDAGARVALFLASLVVSPLLFLGGALLHGDQAARVGSPRRRKGATRADLHPALDPDAPGPPDAERQP